MEIGVISMRYARALLKCGIESETETTIFGEMQTLARSYIEVPELRSTIDNPMLSRAEKKLLITTATGGTPCATTTAFIDLVLDSNRENVLQFIANSYITLYRKHKNIVRGKLTTAVEASPDIQQRMRQMVEAKTQADVEFETEVDKDLIGGFILEYDTYRMDASVRSKLRSVLSEISK